MRSKRLYFLFVSSSVHSQAFVFCSNRVWPCHKQRILPPTSTEIHDVATAAIVALGPPSGVCTITVLGDPSRHLRPWPRPFRQRALADKYADHPPVQPNLIARGAAVLLSVGGYPCGLGLAVHVVRHLASLCPAVHAVRHLVGLGPAALRL